MKIKKDWLKKWAALALCAALLLTLWGCGGKELYERLLIHGVGVDADGDGFTVTVRSSVSPEDEGEEYFKCRGRSVLEALNSLALSTGRQPFYAHNYLVVFGKECAERGLDRCLDFFVRYYNTRPAVQLYLAEGKAEDVLSFQKDGKYLKMSELQQLGDSGKDTGRAVSVELLDFVNGVKRQGSSPVLPVLRAEKEKVEIVSTAYFSGYTLKGFLDLDETRGYLAVKGLLNKGEAVVSGEFGTATLSLSGGSGKVDISGWDGNLPRFSIEAATQGDVSAVSGGRDWLEPRFYDGLETELARVISGEIQAAVDKAVGKDGCDIFGFGSLVYRRDPSRWKRISADWESLMGRCQYAVSVKAKVSRLEQENGGRALAVEN